MSRIACHLPPVGLLLPAAALLAAAPVPDVPDRRPPHQVEAARQLLAKLKKEAAAPKVDVDALWKLWQQMRLEHGGSPECLAAAAVMSKAPSPLDRLDRNQIPEEDRLPWLPKEVVAVLGEHRGRHWGAIVDLLVTPDGKLILSRGWDGLRIWDATTLQERAFYPLGVVTWSADGKTLAANLGARKVQVYERKGVLLKETRVQRITGVPERSDRRMRDNDRDNKAWGVVPRMVGMGFSPDGKSLIGLTDDAVLRVWNLAAKVSEESSIHDAARLQGNEFFLLGRNLVASAWNAHVSVCEVKGGKLRTWCELDGATSPVALHPDGKTLATGLKGPADLRLWDISGKEPKAVADLFGRKEGPEAAAFSPDGRLLASVHFDRTLRLWPMDDAKRKELGMTPQQTHAAYTLKDRACRVAFFPDGKTLALGCIGHTLRLWDVAKSAERFELKGHTAPVRGISFASDGKSLVSTSSDQTTRLWDLTGKRPKGRVILEGDTRWVTITPEGKHLIADQYVRDTKGKIEEVIRLWSISGKALQECSTAPPCVQDISGVALSPDGKWLMTTGSDDVKKPGKEERPMVPTVRLWSLRDEVLGVPIVIRPKPAPADEKEDFLLTEIGAFSPDSKLFAFSMGRQVRLWDLSGKEPKERGELAVKGWWVWEIAFAPDGKTLAVAGDERSKKHGCIWLWELGGAKPRLRATLNVPDVLSTTTVAFSPDGKTLVSISRALAPLVRVHRLHLWNCATGQVLREWSTPGMCGAVFAPDGRHLALANANGTIWLFRLARINANRPEKSGPEKKTQPPA